MSTYPMYYPTPNLQQPVIQGRPTYMDQLQQQFSYLSIKGRPVASIDEAKASMIDFDGSIFYFPDTANKKIYTKQINLDGTSSLKIYTLVEHFIPETPQQSLNNDLISRQEFSSTIAQINSELKYLKDAKEAQTNESTNDANIINQF